MICWALHLTLHIGHAFQVTMHSNAQLAMRLIKVGADEHEHEQIEEIAMIAGIYIIFIIT